MDYKTEKVTSLDSNVVANGIMRDLADVDRMEKMLSTELSSVDLFKIDCAILTSLRNTQDFSRDLLKQLENGEFAKFSARPQKTIDSELKSIQQNAIFDITLPLQNLFDEMASYIEAI